MRTKSKCLKTEEQIREEEYVGRSVGRSVRSFVHSFLFICLFIYLFNFFIYLLFSFV